MRYCCVCMFVVVAVLSVIDVYDANVVFFLVYICTLTWEQTVLTLYANPHHSAPFIIQQIVWEASSNPAANTKH